MEPIVQIYTLCGEVDIQCNISCIFGVRQQYPYIHQQAHISCSPSFPLSLILHLVVEYVRCICKGDHQQWMQCTQRTQDEMDVVGIVLIVYEGKWTPMLMYSLTICIAQSIEYDDDDDDNANRQNSQHNEQIVFIEPLLEVFYYKKILHSTKKVSLYLKHLFDRCHSSTYGISYTARNPHLLLQSPNHSP